MDDRDKMIQDMADAMIPAMEIAAAKVIPPVIDKKVNGKVDRLTESVNKLSGDLKEQKQELDQHRLDDKVWKDKTDVALTELKPVREGLTVVNLCKKFVIWFAAFAVAWGIFSGYFTPLLRFIGYSPQASLTAEDIDRIMENKLQEYQININK